MIRVFPDGCDPPTMQETQEARVQSLGQEDPLEKEMATHSSILAWKIPQRVDWQAIIHGVTKNRTRLRNWVQSIYIYVLISVILILAMILWFVDWWYGDHQDCHRKRREASSIFWGEAERQARSCLLGTRRQMQKFQPKRTLQLMMVNCTCQLGWAKVCPDNWVKHHFGVCLLRMSLDEISFWINRLSKEDRSHQGG